MPDTSLELDLSRVPIFPLPETVLFPRTRLPLHIFEPRYRAMTEHCLSTTSPMAIVLARPGQDLAGHVEIFPVAGVGVIERSERLADGRFNIVLRGVARMRIAEEIPNRPFRLVRGEALAENLASPASLAIPCETLRACVRRVASMAGEPDVASEILRRVESATDPALLADTVGAMLVGDVTDRQALLEDVDVARRLETVTSKIADLLLRADGPGDRQ